MKKQFAGLVLLGIFFIGYLLCLQVEKQNDLATLRIKLPKLTNELLKIEEENTRITYEIDTFENPRNLMKLAKLAEYSELKHPIMEDVVMLGEALAIHVPDERKIEIIGNSSPNTLIGAATYAK